jgi:hypothetical protein
LCLGNAAAAGGLLLLSRQQAGVTNVRGHIRSVIPCRGRLMKPKPCEIQLISCQTMTTIYITAEQSAAAVAVADELFAQRVLQLCSVQRRACWLSRWAHNHRNHAYRWVSDLPP